MKLARYAPAGVILLVVSATIVGAAIAVSAYAGRFDLVILLIVLLLLLSIFLLTKLRNKVKKRVEDVDKGKKFIESVWSWGGRDRDMLLLGVGVYILSIAFIILMELLQGDTKIVMNMLPAIATIPAVIISAFVKRRCEIYEKGISLNYIRFIEWKDVADYEWNNGVLKIKLKRGKMREIVVEDKNGEIKKIVKEKVNNE